MSNTMVVNWMDFAAFIKSDDIWSRWTYQVDGERDTYFINALRLVSENKLGTSFDFSQVQDIQVLSKDDASINWEHDGESLWYFFQKWRQGVRL